MCVQYIVGIFCRGINFRSQLASAKINPQIVALVAWNTCLLHKAEKVITPSNNPILFRISLCTVFKFKYQQSYA